MRRIIHFLGASICAIIVASLLMNMGRIKNEHISQFCDSFSNADVLLVGSSHAYVNLNGAVLWEEYGIPMVSIAQGEQPLNMTYYSLKSALRISSPKLVIVETYMVVTDDAYLDGADKYVSAIIDFPFWSNFDIRLQAVKDIKTDNKIDYVLGFPVYHHSYSLTSSKGTAETAGFINLTEKNEEGQLDDRYSTKNVPYIKEITKKNKEYIDKIINLCDSKNVDVLFLVTPYQAEQNHMSKIKYTESYLEKMGVKFIDMNSYTDEIGIDMDSEMRDWGHALVSGSVKNTKWLGKVLIDEYGFKSRKGDDEYLKWNDVSDYFYQNYSEWL